MKKTIVFPLAVSALLAAFVGVTTAQEIEPGFKSLFNGTDLSGWEGDTKFWSVQDGAITGQTTAENPARSNTFIIYRNGDVDDFELRFQYKLIGGNSGVQYRSTEEADFVVGGYQADFESGTTFSGIMYEERGRGILTMRGETAKLTASPNNPEKHQKEVLGTLGASNEIQGVIKNEDWNDYIVFANGNQFTHIINGRVTSITIDEHAEKFKESGILALQLHAGPPMKVQFRNIRIRSLRPVEITGVWDIVLDANGRTYESVFTFEQSGSTLTGNYKGGLGDYELSGTVEGAEVKFSFSPDMNGQETLFEYSGTLASPAEMSGTIDGGFGETAWTAKKR